MIRALIIATLLISVSSACTHAQQCTPFEEALATIETTHPISRRVTLNAEQTAAVVSWINRLPPPTDDRFNFAAILFHSNGVGLLLGNDGTVCQAGMIDPAKVGDMMRAITGQPA